ncbi:hypothetical protein FHU14_000214 [Mesorhizobium sp. RMAD-H1]|nr:hypothetical protein [Mesorhizobium sp. RMAD-H1]
MLDFPSLTPLCPAGHLPLKGGDYAFIDARHQSQMLQSGGGALCQPISPLKGEISGRAEGGAIARAPSFTNRVSPA